MGSQMCDESAQPVGGIGQLRRQGLTPHERSVWTALEPVTKTV